MKVTTLPEGKAFGYKGQITREAKSAKGWTAQNGSMRDKSVQPKIKVEKIADHQIVTIVKKDAKRTGTASGDRFASAVKYLAKNKGKKISLEVLLANSDYTVADFRHDVKKGFVKVGK